MRTINKLYKHMKVIRKYPTGEIVRVWKVM